MFSYKFIYKNKVANTITGTDNCILFDEKRYRSKKEVLMCGTYPQDYNFINNKPEYLVGMSVPPVMTANIATEIYKQWLNYL